MAKFFRFIVNLCIICFLLIGVALIAPQFMGVTTVVVDEEITDTDLDMGVVVYGKAVSLRKLEVGDKLLRTTNTSVYVSRITEADSASGKYTVVGKDGTLENMSLRGTAEKVLVTIPFIGYVSIAMQTFEGRIILGLVLALLVILFILSEIWKSSEDEEEYSEAEEGEAELTRSEKKARRKEEKRRKKMEKKGLLENEDGLNDEETGAGENESATEGFSDFSYEQDEESQELILESLDEIEEIAEEETAESPIEEEQEFGEEPTESSEEDEFAEALQAALEGMVDKKPDSMSDVKAAEEEETETMVEEEPVVSNEARILAIPTVTAEELLEKAVADGDQPKIVEDEEDGITFIDYSDVL